MQSSTSGEMPSQMKYIPPINAEMLDPLTRFSDMLANINSNNPRARSYVAEQLRKLVPLMQQIASSQNLVHYATRDLRGFPEAHAILAIRHDPNSVWDQPVLKHFPRILVPSPLVSIVLSPDYEVQNITKSRFRKLPCALLSSY
jgi:hypothetical protein